MNIPLLVRSALGHVYRDSFFCRMANRKIGVMADNDLLWDILQAAPGSMIFKEHVSPPHPTQMPPMFSPCLQNLVKTVKHGIRYPSQTHPHLSFQTASCHSTLCFSSTRRTAASTSSSPFVCLILAQASSSTQSTLPTSSHLGKALHTFPRSWEICFGVSPWSLLFFLLSPVWLVL